MHIIYLLQGIIAVKPLTFCRVTDVAGAAKQAVGRGEGHDFHRAGKPPIVGVRGSVRSGRRPEAEAGLGTFSCNLPA